VVKGSTWIGWVIIELKVEFITRLVIDLIIEEVSVQTREGSVSGLNFHRDILGHKLGWFDL
jgi:hypothetical protein